MRRERAYEYSGSERPVFGTKRTSNYPTYSVEQSPEQAYKGLIENRYFSFLLHRAEFQRKVEMPDAPAAPSIASRFLPVPRRSAQFLGVRRERSHPRISRVRTSCVFPAGLSAILGPIRKRIEILFVGCAH